MSLEERLSSLEEAIKENSELLRGLTARAKSASAGNDEKPAKATESKKDDDGEDRPSRGRGRPRGSGKEKTPTVADMKAKGEEFLNVEDEDEYQERRKVVRAVAAYFEAETFSKIESKDRLLAVKLINFAEKKGDEFDPEDVQAAVDEIEGDGEAEEKPSRRRRNDDV